MNASGRYKRGTSFPHEGFVQASIVRYFESLGFKDSTEGHTDLIAVNPRTGERWIVEAKGQTSQVGLDFRTGLGQLLQGMADQESIYALAVPDTP